MMLGHNLIDFEIEVIITWGIFHVTTMDYINQRDKDIDAMS